MFRNQTKQWAGLLNTTPIARLLMAHAVGLNSWCLVCSVLCPVSSPSGHQVFCPTCSHHHNHAEVTELVQKGNLTTLVKFQFTLSLLCLLLRHMMRSHEPSCVNNLKPIECFTASQNMTCRAFLLGKSQTLSSGLMLCSKSIPSCHSQCEINRKTQWRTDFHHAVTDTAIFGWKKETKYSKNTSQLNSKLLKE